MNEPYKPVTREAEFLRLLATHDAQIAACVHALIPLWNDAEDVLQDTRTRLWEQFDQFEPGSNFAAWARTVARYQVRGYYTQQGRERMTFSPEVVEAISARIDSEPDAGEYSEALVHCVRLLSKKHQLLLHQHYTQGMKLPEIAELSGRSLSGLYSTFTRIRGQLLGCVRRRLSGESEQS